MPIFEFYVNMKRSTISSPFFENVRQLSPPLGRHAISYFGLCAYAEKIVRNETAGRQKGDTAMTYLAVRKLSPRRVR